MRTGCASCRNCEWNSCEPDAQVLNEQMIRHAGQHDHDVIKDGVSTPFFN
jgi:hypothetical protein